MEHQQPPILGVVSTGEAGGSTVTAWDGRAEVALGMFIARYLASDPPPATSRVAEDLREWSQRLQRDGQSLLELAGARRLQAV